MKFVENIDPILHLKIQVAHDKAIQALQSNGINYSDENLELVLNPRMRSTAGRAHLLTNKIELNYRLLKGNDLELENTYLHELAHIVAYYIFGRAERGHGPRWGKIMRIFGLPPERCHSLETTHLRRKLTRYLYSCSEGCEKNESKFKLTPNSHKKFNKKYPYRCPKCKLPLSFSGNMVKI